jgi:hypothetical protein
MKKADLIALLIKVGIKKENAEKIAQATAEESTETIDVDILMTEWKENQIALMRNEPAIVDDIRASELAKQRNLFEQKIKQVFGLTGEEIKDKKYDEIISLAKEKASSKTDRTATELQDQILLLTNENKRLLEEEIPKIKNETTLHKKKFDINQALMKKIPMGDDKLRIPFETASKLALSDLNEFYDIDMDENGSVVLLEKGKELKAKSKDGTKFLTADEVINERLEFHKALVKSNSGGASTGNTSTGSATVVVEGAKSTVVTPALSKAEQHAATMKANQEAARAAKA